MTETRKEITGKRDLGMSQWIRDNLPSSYKGFRVTDIDFYLKNPVTKKHMLIEVKTNNGGTQFWQHEILKDFAKWLRHGSAADGWHYIGTFIVSLSDPDPGECSMIRVFDVEKRCPPKDMTEAELSAFLSMETI